MRALLYTFAVPFLLLLIIACSKPEDKLVGHFTGKMQMDPGTRSKLLENGDPQAAQMVQSMESATWVLDLQKDKTYTMNISAGPDSTTNSGTWSFEDGVITCSMSGGKNPTKMTPSEDGNTLTSVNQSDNKSVITFTRG